MRPFTATGHTQRWMSGVLSRLGWKNIQDIRSAEDILTLIMKNGDEYEISIIKTKKG